MRAIAIHVTSGEFTESDLVGLCLREWLVVRDYRTDPLYRCKDECGFAMSYYPEDYERVSYENFE